MTAAGSAAPARRPLIAANWKMHLAAGEPSRYVAAFLQPPPDLADRDAVLFAPAPLLAETARALAGSGIAAGAQTIHWEDRGAFTGEVSGPMVASVGATYCLVGHSERRHLFGEDHAAVALKLRAALRNGLRPVLCVGERIEERRAGRALATVEAQLRSALEACEAREALEAPETPRGGGPVRLAVAYEPVWAIGTGETATPEVAAEMHAAVRAVLAEVVGGAVASAARVLYGGSVTPANVDALMGEPEIDGALVGGASLAPASFRRILDFGRPAHA